MVLILISHAVQRGVGQLCRLSRQKLAPLTWMSMYHDLFNLDMNPLQYMDAYIQVC